MKSSNKGTPRAPQQLVEYLGLLKSQAWTIAMITLAVTMIAVVVIALLPDRYRATTTILVDPQRIPDRYVASTVTADPAERLNTLTPQVLSASRLGEIIDALNLYPEMKQHSRDEVIEHMRGQITLQVKQGPSQGLSSFTISYESGSAKLAAIVTNQLAASFIDWNLRNRAQLAEATTKFIASQLEEAKQNLQTQEQKLSEFKMQHVGQLPDQVQANLQTVARLQSAVQTNADALNRLEQEKQLLLRLPGPSSSSSGPVQLTERQRLEQDEHQLKNEVWDLKKKYTESHPDVVAAESRLKQVQQQLKALPPDLVAVKDSSPTGVRLDLIEKEEQRLTRENRDLQAQIATYQGRVDSVPLREQELSALTRDYEISKEQYRSLLEKTYSAEMATDLEKRQEGEHFTILDPARPPERPFRPKRLGMMYGALAGAFFFAIAVVIVRDNLSGAIKAERELKELLPASTCLLGSIPTIETAADRSQRIRLHVLEAAMSLLACLAVAIILWKVHPIL
jgi:polysaccharide biosynthesis transport protein